MWLIPKSSCHNRHEAGGAGGRRVRLAALVMEPLVQGAGGMALIDPLWQRAAARVCRLRPTRPSAPLYRTTLLSGAVGVTDAAP